MSTQLFTRNYYDISSAELLSDNGMIFRDETSLSFRHLKSEKTVVDIYNDNDRLMLNFSFSSGLLKKVLVRRYLKVPELFANIGGFIKAVNLLCQILINDYSTFVFFNKFKTEVGLNSQKVSKLRLRVPFTKDVKQEAVNVDQNESNQKMPREKPATSAYEVISYCFWLNHRYFKWKNSLIDTNDIKSYFDIGELQQKRNEMEARLTLIEEKLSN